LRTVLGAALYRASRTEEAIQHLEQAAKIRELPGPNNVRSSLAYTWFFLALAHQGRGNTKESRRCLNKATELTDQELKNPVPWNRKLTLDLLRHEAAAAVGRAEMQ
jgi:tetratricopeptide (TPR) repeat protein